MIRRAQQEEGRIKSVHGVMPNQRGQNSEAQHDEANDYSAKSYFQAADEKRLIGIKGVQKSPNEGRKHNGQRPPFQIFPQQRDGKSAELDLFGNRREEANEQDRHPREAGIEQIRKGDIHRSPRAQFIGGKIEHRLVGEEEKSQGDSHHVRQEERARAQALPTEVAANRQEARISFTIEGLGTGHQQEDGGAQSQGHEEVFHHVVAHETGIGIRGVIFEFRQREHVQLAEKIEERRHQRKTE